MSGAVGFFLLGANYALYGVAPKYYPGPIRGTGSGASVAVGRVGSILGPLLAGLLMGRRGERDIRVALHDPRGGACGNRGAWR